MITSLNCLDATVDTVLCKKGRKDTTMLEDNEIVVFVEFDTDGHERGAEMVD